VQKGVIQAALCLGLTTTGNNGHFRECARIVKNKTGNTVKPGINPIKPEPGITAVSHCRTVKRVVNPEEQVGHTPVTGPPDPLITDGKMRMWDV